MDLDLNEETSGRENMVQREVFCRSKYLEVLRVSVRDERESTVTSVCNMKVVTRDIKALLAFVPPTVQRFKPTHFLRKGRPSQRSSHRVCPLPTYPTPTL